MILVKDDGNLQAEELIQMVKEINASEVRAEDKLTDSVYHYDKKRFFRNCPFFASNEIISVIKYWYQIKAVYGNE